MPNLGSPFKCGHKFPGGLPMSDAFHDMINAFYHSAVKKGYKESYAVFFRQFASKFEQFLNSPEGITYRNFS